MKETYNANSNRRSIYSLNPNVCMCVCFKRVLIFSDVAVLYMYVQIFVYIYVPAQCYRLSYLVHFDMSLKLTIYRNPTPYSSVVIYACE